MQLSLHCSLTRICTVRVQSTLIQILQLYQSGRHIGVLLDVNQFIANYLLETFD